jgi:hypothetical protein
MVTFAIPTLIFPVIFTLVFVASVRIPRVTTDVPLGS